MDNMWLKVDLCPLSQHDPATCMWTEYGHNVHLILLKLNQI